MTNPWTSLLLFVSLKVFMIYHSLFYLPALLISGIALYELPSGAESTIVIREPFAIAQEPLETGPPVASVDPSAPIQIRVINESTNERP
ncbi:hypothetical protein [Synechococcus sp. PCC 7335]|uniref:hypothetical protein n=1 Tax=Synechococcus sp. (strain ATCC 29403 / PCC 7335) TaxID=91464 RepID=UPI00056DBA14|nr:hypothetical protein [Synechococcus sp. PCC 7335]